MDVALAELVWERARRCCEYCRMPQIHDELLFEIDHVVAEQHGGKTVASNLALACFADNHHKGPNLAGIDAKTRRRTWLFNPRRHKWARHFRWDGPILVGRTAVGRATIAASVRRSDSRCKQLNDRPAFTIIRGSLTPETESAMRIRGHSKGKFYLIECPDGTMVVRCAVRL